MGHSPGLSNRGHSLRKIESTSSHNTKTAVTMMGSSRTTMIRILLASTTLALVAGTSSVSQDNSGSLCQEKEWREHPVLCHFVERAHDDLDALAAELHQSAKAQGWLVDLETASSTTSTGSDASVTSVDRERNLRTGGNPSGTLSASTAGLPVVLAHGMGDSCFNSGMQHITEKVSDLLGGVYTVCIPTGDSQSSDTKNGYFLSMDDSVDAFAAGVAADSNLQQGFHAIGFSQGNNVIRGYIAKVNNPAVHTFISVNGVNAGIGAVPYCQPDVLPTQSSAHTTDGLNDDTSTVQFSMCDLLMEQASRSAYTDFSQKNSFQANYWRDPRPSAVKEYQTYSQLAVWNNEQDAIGGHVNETLKENWSKTQAFVWVLATEDGMIWPREGEQWGAPDPADPFHDVLPMKETEWYQKDLFGLKAAEKAGKNHFESFAGDHLSFTEEDFERWVATYLKA
jgi:palmitoyl-protein thioesterase